jgi:hypothetical protein
MMEQTASMTHDRDFRSDAIAQAIYDPALSTALIAAPKDPLANLKIAIDWISSKKFMCECISTRIGWVL